MILKITLYEINLNENNYEWIMELDCNEDMDWVDYDACSVLKYGYKDMPCEWRKEDKETSADIQVDGDLTRTCKNVFIGLWVVTEEKIIEELAKGNLCSLQRQTLCLGLAQKNARKRSSLKFIRYIRS